MLVSERKKNNIHTQNNSYYKNKNHSNSLFFEENNATKNAKPEDRKHTVSENYSVA